MATPELPSPEFARGPKSGEAGRGCGGGEGKKLGAFGEVPEIGKWENPSEVDAENSDPLDQERRARAEELGLIENTSWAEIFAFEDQQERARIAKGLGWYGDPKSIAEARRLGMDEYPSWRNILTTAFGLDETAPPEEIIERIQQARAGES